jgi:hypothetical protein
MLVVLLFQSTQKSNPASELRKRYAMCILHENSHNKNLGFKNLEKNASCFWEPWGSFAFSAFSGKIERPLFQHHK